MNIRNRPARLRRVQLSVPGSSEKMLQKAAGSDADHVFCDLEDAVAPSAKPGARELIATALNELDWGKKTRCVRINDVTTQWCHDDIITLVEKAGKNIDTIMLTKPRSASDVMFLHLMLHQLEQKLGLKRRIGIEVLIEEVEALQNVEAIATCSDRMECLIFGMGDYSAAQGIDTRVIGEGGDYPGDIFHYARFRVTRAQQVSMRLMDPLVTLRTKRRTRPRLSRPDLWVWLGNGQFTQLKSNGRLMCLLLKQRPWHMRASSKPLIERRRLTVLEQHK